MSIPVLTAVSDAAWEAELAAGFGTPASGVQLVRRCVDLADLLAAAGAGVARAAVLSADLRHLDREALSRLGVAGVAVVGLVGGNDERSEMRLRQLGIGQVLTRLASPVEVADAVVAAVSTGQLADSGGVAGDEPEGEEAPAAGRLVVVWGPAGAPGRSTTALNVAAEAADLGCPTLLVDADPYGGVSAQLLGLLDEAPGLAAACRAANNGTLDLPGLAALAVTVRPRLRVLTGISRASRWPELRPSAVDVVLSLARRLVDLVVVDVGFCLEQDEELAYDTIAPRRNGATLTALAAADSVIGVAAADPVGLARYVRGLAELAECAPDVRPMTVVNRLRRGVIGAGDPRREVGAALERYAGVRPASVIPDDPAALDLALARGRTLAEAAAGSPARAAFRELAATLVGAPAARAARRRRWSLSRR